MKTKNIKPVKGYRNILQCSGFCKYFIVSQTQIVQIDSSSSAMFIISIISICILELLGIELSNFKAKAGAVAKT